MMIGSSGWKETALHEYPTVSPAHDTRLPPDVLSVTVQGVDTRLRLVIPDLDESVVGTGHEVRFVASGIVVDAIDALVVALHREIRRSRAEIPNFDCLIQTGRRKCVVVLRVDDELHHVMTVTLEHLWRKWHGNRAWKCEENDGNWCYDVQSQKDISKYIEKSR